MMGVERGAIRGDARCKASGIGTRPLRRLDVVCIPIDGEAVLYDDATTTTFRLNATGFRIWRLCDGRNTVDDVVESIRATYDVGESTARVDVGAAVAEMARTGIIGWDES